MHDLNFSCHLLILWSILWRSLDFQFFYWVYRWAAANLTTNLRFDNLGVQVTWIGKRRMKLGEIITCTEKTLMKFSPTAYLIIHLGGNDITSIKSEELCTRLEHDIRYLKN